MRSKGWSQKDFAKTTALKPDRHSKALCDNEIDAFVFTAGHPNASIKEAATTCDIVMVSVLDATIKELVNKHSYLEPVVISGDIYPGAGWSAPTFGVMSTLVTSVDTPKEVVYEVVKSLFKDYFDFKLTHPALSGLKPKKMIKRQAAPHHPGAMRYFLQMGYKLKNKS